MRSDEVLAQGIQQGNQADMNELVNRYYDAILRYQFRMCGGRQTLAEDMAQETFLRMIRKITMFDTTRAFRPWLYAIATNIARNFYNKADTRYTENPDESADFEDSNQQPEGAIIESQTAETVATALSQIPDHQREVVVLFYFEEMSQKDIAGVLNIPTGTVKSRLSIGLKRLRQAIEILEERS